MSNNTDLPQQPDTPQQQLPRSFKSQKPLKLLAAVLLIAIALGTGGYLLGIKNNQSISLSQPSPSPQPALITQLSLTTIPSSTSVISIRPVPTCDTTPHFVPASQSLRNTNMEVNTWATYDGTGELGEVNEKATHFSLKYPSSWDSVGAVLYPYGKPLQNVPCGYYNPKVELGIGGFGWGDRKFEERTYQAGKAAYFWDTSDQRSWGLYMFNENHPLIIRVSDIHPNESAVMQTILGKMLNTVQFNN